MKQHRLLIKKNPLLLPIKLFVLGLLFCNLMQDARAQAVMVKDIVPGVGSAFPEELTAINDKVYFRADDGINGHELWKSDGTVAGTMMVKDIRPGSDGGLGPNQNQHNFIVVNGTLFFIANNGIDGDELWKSDGTAAGTVMIPLGLQISVSRKSL